MNDVEIRDLATKIIKELRKNCQIAANGDWELYWHFDNPYLTVENTLKKALSSHNV